MTRLTPLIFLPCLLWGKWGEPVKLPPQINDIPNAIDIYYARLSPDGKHLYFTNHDGYHSDDIWVARWNGVDWDSVTRLGARINDNARNLSPSVTADGKKLYFVSYGRAGGYGAYDVWFSEWDSVANDWGEPKNCGENINTPAMEFTACISPDGKKLYIDRSADLYCSTWQDTGWGPAENLGSNINTFSDEYCPWISADGKTLYFASWFSGHQGPDIFVSYWTESGWSESYNLGPPINLSFDRIWTDSPSLAPDGRTIIFSSNRGDTMAPQDLYMSRWLGAVEENGDKVLNQALMIYSNPTSSPVEIRYSLPANAKATLSIYDVTGKLIKSFSLAPHSSLLATGIIWDGRDTAGSLVPNGLYFIRLETSNYSATRKLVLTRRVVRD